MLGIKRITTGQPATLSFTWYPQDSETATDPDGTPAACTFGITHVNGTVITAAGTAATRTGVGVFTFPIPTQTTPADLVVTLSATFGGQSATATQYVSVIAAHLVDLAEIRALDGLNDATAYPTSLLVEKRDDAEVLFELATGMYWSHHYCRDLLDGDPNYRRALQSAVQNTLDYIPTRRLVLTQRYPVNLLSVTLLNGQLGEGAGNAPQVITNRSVTDGVTVSGSPVITSATMNWTANGVGGGSDVGGGISGPGIPLGAIIQSVQSATHATMSLNATASASGVAMLQNNLIPFVLYKSGEIEMQMGASAWPRGMENVVIEYVAGADAPPQDLRKALKQYIRYLVLDSNARMPDRATSMTTEFGTFRIGQAKAWDNPTGIAEVDAVLGRYGLRVPNFA